MSEMPRIEKIDTEDEGLYIYCRVMFVGMTWNGTFTCLAFAALSHTHT